MHSAVGAADVQGRRPLGGRPPRELLRQVRGFGGGHYRFHRADLRLRRHPGKQSCALRRAQPARRPASGLGADRSGALLQGGPANYYAEFLHKNAINGLAYGFPYDDDAGQSSDISVTSPKYMVVAVGW
jgi:hypothetical protein